MEDVVSAQQDARRVPVWNADDPTNKLGIDFILERRDVPELRELRQLRLKGWQEEELNEHFSAQRRDADRRSASSGQSHYWVKTMRNVLQELDRVRMFVPYSSQRQPFEFLDVGCAPGGFSTYVLSKNVRSTGVGISLPEHMSGHSLAIDAKLRQRYEYVEQDLLRYDLSPVSVERMPDEAGSWGEPFPEEYRGRFPLVLLDGHALRTYPTNADTPVKTKLAHASYRDALLIGQLIIAFMSSRTGKKSTVVVKLSHAECFPTAHLIYLLDTVSSSLFLYKPKRTHSNRGTFYAIAKGVGAGARRAILEQYLEGLQALWHDLRFGGAEKRGRYLVSTDLDFIVTADAILDDYLGRLIELSREVWATQATGLQEFFRKKGIE
ncbi:hypothetical protein FKP32DRAFT_1676085 [Trametes sanguinea]|nr:hypothetical protein FKP32DRAFT_1676085 [Trametes sanguinea]